MDTGIIKVVGSYAFRARLKGAPGMLLPTQNESFTDKNNAEETIWGKWLFATAGGATQYTLTVDAGVYATNSSSVVLLRILAAGLAAGTYSVPGQNVALRRRFTTTASAGAYATVSTNAATLANRSLLLSPGSRSGAGTVAGLRVLRYLSAGGNAYPAAYTNAGVRASRRVSIAAGGYVTTVASAGLKAARMLRPDAVAYSVTGEPVTVSSTQSNYELAITAGAYTSSHLPHSLQLVRRTHCTSVQYSVTAGGVLMTAARVIGAGSWHYSMIGRDVLLVNNMVKEARLFAALNQTSSIAAKICGTHHKQVQFSNSSFARADTAEVVVVKKLAMQISDD